MTTEVPKSRIGRNYRLLEVGEVIPTGYAYTWDEGRTWEPGVSGNAHISQAGNMRQECHVPMRVPKSHPITYATRKPETMPTARTTEESALYEIVEATIKAN